MRAEKSILNKSILLGNLAKGWPISVVVFILSYFFNNVFLRNAVNNKDSFGEAWGLRSQIMQNMIGVHFHLFFTAFIASFLVFGFLFKERLCFQIHSFPLKRKTVFFTSALSGFLLLIIPQILNWLLMLSDLSASGIKFIALEYLIIIITFSLMYYSTGVIAAMITGNLISMSIVYAVINLFNMFLFYLSAVFEAVFLSTASFSSLGKTGEAVLNVFRYILPVGVSADVVLYEPEPASPVNKHIMFTDFRFLIYLLYFAAGSLLLILSYRLYSVRRLEKAGSSIIFDRAKFIINIIANAMAAVFIYFILYIFFDTTSENYSGLTLGILFIVIGTIVSYAVKMILEKTVKINFAAELLKWIAAAAAICLVFAVYTAEVNRYVPKKDEIVKIDIKNTEYYEQNLNDVYFGTSLKEPEEISEMVDIHKKALKSEKLIGFAYSDAQSDHLKIYNAAHGIVSLDLTYTLKNGGVYHKNIIVDDSESKDIINALFKSNNINSLHYDLGIEDIDTAEYSKYVQISSVFNDNDRCDLELAQDEIKELLKAYGEDLCDNDPNEECGFYIRIEIIENDDQDLYRENEVKQTDRNSCFHYLYFNKNYKNTVELTEKILKRNNVDPDMFYKLYSDE